MDLSDAFSVRAVVAENDTLVQWVASGPSLEPGKRWRKLFDNREAAEEYIREERRIRATLGVDNVRKHESSSTHVQDAVKELKAHGKTVNDAVAFYLKHLDHTDSDTEGLINSGNGVATGAGSRIHKSSRSSPFSGRRLAVMLLLIAVAFAFDRMLRLRTVAGDKGKTLAANFESNPLLAGWTSSGQGVTWTPDEHVSGARSVLVQTGTLSSPMLAGKPMQWYRLAFQSKATGTVTNIGSTGYGYCAVLFYDEAGNQLGSGIHCSITRSDSWQPNEFRFRADSLVGSGGELRPSRMKVIFETIGSQPFFVDDVVVEEVNAPDVMMWADAFYDRLPAKLQYHPKASRWDRLPLTMEKLKRGDQIRIVMLGDSIQQDLANCPLDLYLQKLYPGCRVEIIPSIKAGMGAEYFKDHVEEYITRFKPDLLVIGGISNRDDMEDFQSIADEVRSINLLTKRKTEIMVMTNAWSPNSVPQNGFTLSPSTKELDQKPENNDAIPKGYRGDLLKFAAANEVELLDMQGIVSEFIYGPATGAKVGPPAGANGDPYSYWMRDWVHPNDMGRQIMGRILQRYFTPSIQKTNPMPRPEIQKAKAHTFDPEKNAPDYGVLKEVLGEFQVEKNERPILAETFSSGSQFALDHMILKDGFAMSEPDKNLAQATYNFETPLDVRDGEIVVYWAFKSNVSKGQELNNLQMNLNLSDAQQSGVSEVARIALNVRPHLSCVLYHAPGGPKKNEPEIQTALSTELFPDTQTVEKFRMVIRRMGGDRVEVQPSWWSRTSFRWENFGYSDKSMTGPVVMELSLSRHLSANSAFKSLCFQAYSDAPKLDTVLLTRRLQTRSGE